MPIPQRYGEPTGDPKLGRDSAHDLDAITDHIEKWWGKDGMVYHEIVSEYVHVDIFWVKPTSARPYHVLITSGMSDRPMKAGKEDRGCYAELLIALPPDWPLDEESFKDERNWWPIRHLKQTARFPHVHETLIWYGHTISNEAPLEKFADDVGFCAGILSLPFLCDEEAHILDIDGDKSIHFFSFVPIYEEELQLARTQSSEKLFDLLDEAGVTELIDKSRKNVCSQSPGTV